MSGSKLPILLVLCGAALLCTVSCTDDETATETAPPEAAHGRPAVEQDKPESGTESPRISTANPVEPGSWHTPDYRVETGENWTLHVRNGEYFSTGLADAYRERCYADDDPTPECTALRSLVVADITLALEVIERSRDQRGTAEALVALDLENEPGIQVAAMRVLGRFPDTPGIAEKTWPLLLESPYLQVQELAARLLDSNPDPTLAAVGLYWGANHSTLYAENAYQEYPDFAPHYADMDFPEYPDAEWFSPADSDRSVGWWTTDDFATVSAWLAEELGTEGLDFRAWSERLTQESTAMFQVDPDQQAEVQRLIEEWTKTQDMAVLEKMTRLQEEMAAPAQAASEILDKGVSGIGPPSTTEALEQMRYFIAEERAGHVARLVIAFPLASLNRTVIQHSWNLSDYPSAWPPEEEDSQE